MDYKNGKIYKLVNDVNDDIYVGSTASTLAKRKGNHKKHALVKNSTIYKTMREIGPEHFDIILIESFSCNSKDELRAREDYWIRQLKPALNMINAVANVEKQKLRKQNYDSQYALNNPLKLEANKKKWFAENHQKELDRMKQYQIDNKAKIKERKRLKRLADKETKPLE